LPADERKDEEFHRLSFETMWAVVEAKHPTITETLNDSSSELISPTAWSN
jgi:hypothetical protein